MRIASLSPAVTEILFALELQDCIVCTDQFSNYPDATKDIPHVRDHVNVHPKDLYEYEADLVFTSTVIQEKLAEQLKAQDFSTVHFDPRTINGVYDMIRSIGLMMQCDDKAKGLVLSMQQAFNDVKKKAAFLPKRLKVYVEEWHMPPFASGNWVPEVARFAGVDQFPVQAGELSPEVTLAQVMEWDPDFIVLSWCGAGLHVEKELFTNRKGWNALRAVQSGDVRVIDDSFLNRPGPRLVEGARRLYGWTFEMQH